VAPITSRYDKNCDIADQHVVITNKGFSCELTLGLNKTNQYSSNDFQKIDILSFGQKLSLMFLTGSQQRKFDLSLHFVKHIVCLDFPFFLSVPFGGFQPSALIINIKVKCCGHLSYNKRIFYQPGHEVEELLRCSALSVDFGDDSEDGLESHHGPRKRKQARRILLEVKFAV
jgi:hypothetical protein